MTCFPGTYYISVLTCFITKLDTCEQIHDVLVLAIKTTNMASILNGWEEFMMEQRFDVYFLSEGVYCCCDVL